MRRMFEGHRLHSSPLCLSVPLEGTDKVQGLHSLERSALEEWRRSPAPPGSTRSRKYKGRRLSNLTAADLHAAARPWGSFLGRDAPTFDHAFTLPGDLDGLTDRMEANLVYWAANYARVVMVFVFMAMYLRPRAVLGLATLAGSGWAALRRLQPGSGAVVAAGDGSAEDEATEAERTHQPDHDQPGNRIASEPGTEQMLVVAVAVLTFVTVTWSGCLPILALGLTLGAGAVLTHAALRTGSEDDRAAKSPRRGPTTGPTTAPHLPAQGWPLAQVFGLRASPPGSEPRRALRQATTHAWATCHGSVRGVSQRCAVTVRQWWSERRFAR